MSPAASAVPRDRGNAGLRAPARAGVPRHVCRNRRANDSTSREAKLQSWAGGRCISSTDAGATWTLPVSVSASKFFALNVHPTNPLEILAATSAGIQKSTDGGVTWTTKLSQFYGTELARVPNAPLTILATVWDMGSASASGNGFVYRSTDA